MNRKDPKCPTTDNTRQRSSENN